MEYLLPPWAHQLKAIENAKTQPNYALFMSMGTGKTSTAINILRHRFNESRSVLRTLIFCPPIVVPNWKDEWAKYSRIEPGKVVLLRGPGKNRLRDFRNAAYDEEGKRRGAIFVTNYEALLMADLYKEFLAWAPQALVYDESHKLKDAKAKRSKLAEVLSNPREGKIKFDQPFKLILSGSPVLNSPMDLFMQFLILDGGATFGSNFFIFRARYFRDKNAGMPKDRYFPEWEVMPGAIEEMNRLIYTKAIRVKKEECMDLPPLVRTVVKVGMTPEQARLYKEMKNDLIAFISDDKVATGPLAITKALRLQQIASGYIKSVEGVEVSLEGSPKADALEELLEELTPHSKVLVWAVWHQNYEQIRAVCAKLGVGYVEVHGLVSEKQKQENVLKFRSDEKIRVFIGHPGSAGIGLNLVEASYSIFFSRNFSLEHSLQAEARNHRGGSEIHEKITRIDLVTENTLDEIISCKLASKEEMGEKLLRDLSLELKNQRN